MSIFDGPQKDSEVKQGDTDIMSSVELLFLHLVDQINEVLQPYKHELVQQCLKLRASDIHKINLFTADQIKRLSDSNVLIELGALLTWSNFSILKSMTGCSGDATMLVDDYESKLDLLQQVTSFPVPCLYSNMIPSNTSAHTILAVRYNRELFQCTLQDIYDVQLMMVEKCDITQHCVQLLATRSDPTILYWTIPKCVVHLINANVPLHSEYFFSRGILEVLVYPNILLSTGDDVCIGSLAFNCNDQLFNEEVGIVDILDRIQSYKINTVNDKSLTRLKFCRFGTLMLVCCTLFAEAFNFLHK